jgi:hypothetical protein
MRYGFSKINMKWKFKIRIKTTLTNFARCTRFGTQSLPLLKPTRGPHGPVGPLVILTPRDREGIVTGEGGRTRSSGDGVACGGDEKRHEHQRA